MGKFFLCTSIFLLSFRISGFSFQESPVPVSVTDQFVLTYVSANQFKIKHVPTNVEKTFNENSFFFSQNETVQAVGNLSNTVANRAANTKAIQAAVHFQNHNGSVYFPAGIYHYDEVQIRKTRIRLFGEGDLSNGTLFVGYENIHQGHSYFEVDGLTFREGGWIPDAIANTKPLIVLRNIEGGTISNCHFYGGVAAIKVAGIDYDDTQLWWHAGKIIVTNNQFFSNNHALKVEKHANVAPGRYSAGDFHFINNMLRSMQGTSIDSEGQDGLVVQGNTFFSAKGRHIYIRQGHYIKITCNHLFENDQESIFLQNVRDFQVSNNTIVKPGWVDCGTNKYSGIRIQNWGLYGGGSNYNSDEALARGTIANNSIRWPSLYGIDIRGGRGITVSNNIVDFPTISDWQSWNICPANTRPPDTQWAIFADDNSTFCQFIDNITLGHPNQILNCCGGPSQNFSRQNAQMGN
ncbi:right-handed parallel beta-helix repeat-containing protein [Fulvivirgaceae bacterium BMA12]|uniref:Right-handed parallel beta-helix repeat-containing protein n=1 Tax=Agaribacillus aureus TaxID=3051825 RepID=A0ABT8L6T2_9BACT|nr:right-handed parallel beta-helix repeat-containing protein [Fulvivirgaceae bacterium BMA12]